MSKEYETGDLVLCYYTDGSLTLGIIQKKIYKTIDYEKRALYTIFWIDSGSEDCYTEHSISYYREQFIKYVNRIESR